MCAEIHEKPGHSEKPEEEEVGTLFLFNLRNLKSQMLEDISKQCPKEHRHQDMLWLSLPRVGNGGSVGVAAPRQALRSNDQRKYFTNNQQG